MIIIKFWVDKMGFETAIPPKPSREEEIYAIQKL